MPELVELRKHFCATDDDMVMLEVVLHMAKNALTWDEVAHDYCASKEALLSFLDRCNSVPVNPACRFDCRER